MYLSGQIWSFPLILTLDQWGPFFCCFVFHNEMKELLRGRVFTIERGNAMGTGSTLKITLFLFHMNFVLRCAWPSTNVEKKRTNKQGMLHDAWKYFYLTISKAIWIVARNFHRWIRKAKQFLVRCVFCFGVKLRRNMILIFSPFSLGSIPPSTEPCGIHSEMEILHFNVL